MLSRAWRVTRHERGFWPLALLATGVVGGVALPSFGNSGSLSNGAGGSRALPPGLSTSEVFQALSQVLGPDARPLLVGVGVFWALILFGLWLLAVRCEATLAWSTLQFAREGAVSRRTAWREGRHFFGRFAAVSLVAWLFGLLLAGILLAWAATHRPDDTLVGWWRGYMSAAGSPFLFLGTLLLLPLRIWLTYARRCIALLDVSLGHGLAAGWRTLRRHFGDSLLGWIINMAFYTAAIMGILVVIGVLTLVGVIVFAIVLRTLPHGTASLAGGVAPYIAAGVLAVVVLMLLGLSMVSLFLWSFWSQLYLRLSAPVYDDSSVALG